MVEVKENALAPGNGSIEKLLFKGTESNGLGKGGKKTEKLTSVSFPKHPHIPFKTNIFPGDHNKF